MLPSVLDQAKLFPTEATALEVKAAFLECFYDTRDCTSWYLPLLQRPLPIRPNTLARYTELFLSREVKIERSFPRDAVFDSNLPNVVELTVWWVTYLKMYQGYHGMRSYRTPSSTHLEDATRKDEKGVLCITLLVNDMLGFAPSYRSDTSEIIHPPSQT